MTPRPFHPSRALLAPALALAGALLLAGPARAQCSYVNQPAWQTFTIPGTSGVGVIPGAAMKSSWLVAAVRPVAGDDWDMVLYPTTGPAPNCIGGSALATSTYGGSIVDFVIGDGATNAHTDVYPRWYRYSGSYAPRIAWTDSAYTLAADDMFRYWYFAPDTLVRVHQFQLTAGVTYEIRFDPTVNPGGSIGATAHLFRNPGTGTYWAGRPSALASFTGRGTFTAPATGNYALVVANDQRAQGAYILGVAACAMPEPLVSKNSVYPATEYPSYQFTPNAARWGAVSALVPAFNGPTIYAARDLAGVPPNCFSDFRLWCPPIVGPGDFQLGLVDFHHAAMQTYYIGLEQRGSATYAALEWDAGTSALAVDGPMLSGALDISNPADVFDLELTGGVTYNIYFSTDVESPRLMLLGEGLPGSGGFLQPGEAVFTAYGSGRYTFTAPYSDVFGLVVVGSTYGYGEYWVAVASEDCPFPTLLTNDVPASVPGPDGRAQFDVLPGWGLLAVRGATAAEDWDLSVSGSPTGNPAPFCIGTSIASSGYGASSLDFVVVRNPRWFHDYIFPAFARAHHSGLGSSPGTVLGTQAAWLAENDPALFATLGPDDPADFYALSLSAGTTYTIEFQPYVTGITAHLFGSQSESDVQAFGRGGAIAGGAGYFTFTPAYSGTYALAIANDRFTGGSYRLRIGACYFPQAIAADTPQECYSGVRAYAVPQTQARWSVFGVRYGDADWDLATGTTYTGTWPSCIGGSGATSSLSTPNFTDFVVTDYHHVTPATWYAKPYQYASAPLVQPRVEWSPAAAVTPNELYGNFYTMGNGDVLKCHEARLVGGVTYTIWFAHQGGADLKLLLFRNPGSGAYWAGRSSAALTLTPGPGPNTYTPPATDDYALVVVNDDGAADQYELSVSYCPEPVALANRTPVTVDPQGFAKFNIRSFFWTAVGVRGPGDWDIAVYGSPTGGPSGECFSSLLQESYLVGPVDFVVGDFNVTPWDTFYVRPFRYPFPGAGTLEWAEGLHVLWPYETMASVTTGPDDVLEIWDVYLEAGHAYNVYFRHAGAADVKAMIFANVDNVPYWAARPQRAWEGTGHGTFYATVSGWHGLVVVNDNGLPGTYDIGISLGGVDAGPPVVPAITALRGVSPNPARGGTTIEYALREPAPVRLDVLDMAGRRVATLEEGERPAGTYRVPWSAVKSAGGAVPPGLYFVRLQVAGRTVGEKKVALVQ